MPREGRKAALYRFRTLLAPDCRDVSQLHGSKGAVSQLRKALSRRTDERVIAVAPTDMRDHKDRIVARVKEIVSVEEARADRELIGLVKDQALSGNLGVFGLEATLNALRKGQVHKVAIADDLRARGWRCRAQACGLALASARPYAAPPRRTTRSWPSGPSRAGREASSRALRPRRRYPGADAADRRPGAGD